jgi:2-hydroxyglutarate dehydrogenase
LHKPNIRSRSFVILQGVKALYSPQTGIVDWAEVARSYAKNFAQSGGQIFLDHEVTKFGSATDPNFPVTITSRSKVCIGTVFLLVLRR